MKILSQVKGIKASMEYSTINEIYLYLKDLEKSLLNYEFNANLDYEDKLIKEYQINKLYETVKNTDLFNLKYKDIILYLDKLISIIEFIEI